MALYKLYVESGPMRKKTMVHVLELLGCVVSGPTTESALEDTPEAIRAYLHFLQGHGEQVQPDEPLQTEIAELITPGGWLGGSLFLWDQEPLAPEDLERSLRWLNWSRTELLEIVSGLSNTELEVLPPSGGRSVKAILEHVYGAEYAYVRLLGKLRGVQGPKMGAQRSREELLAWMAALRASEVETLCSLSQEELAAAATPEKSTRTARRVVRRMLEHEREHLTELQTRFS